MRALIFAEGAARAEIQSGWYAAVRRGVLTLMRPAQASAQNKEIILSFTAEYGIINFQGIQFEFRYLSCMTAADWVRMEHCAAVYADRAQPAAARTANPTRGRFYAAPIGRKKIKDILIDDKNSA